MLDMYGEGADAVEKGQSRNRWRKIGVVMLLCVLVGGLYIYKNAGRQRQTDLVSSPAQTAVKLPRLVELGASTCRPCREMAPILAELRQEYAGRLNVEVIDINENHWAARQYNIRVIPTQILFDAEGKEVMRHEGFIPKKDLTQAFALVGVK